MWREEDREGLRQTWLVKRDVSVLADAAQEKLDAAVLLDALLVGFAFADQVYGVAVEDVHLGRGDVD